MVQGGGGCVRRSYPLRPYELCLECCVKCVYDAAYFYRVVAFFFHFNFFTFCGICKALEKGMRRGRRGIARTSHCVVPNFIKQTANNDTLMGPVPIHCVQTSFSQTSLLAIQFISGVRNRIVNEISCIEIRLPELSPKRKLQFN